MNPILPRRAFLRRAGVALAAVPWSVGCRLQRASLPQRTFLLEPPAPPAAGAGQPAGVLLVRPFRVAPAFESRSFVIRRGDAEYTQDAYHAFLLAPGPMLTNALATWIRGLGAFQSVTTGGSQVLATHALEGEVGALYGDYREHDRPRAILDVQVRLLHPLMGASTPVLWQHDLRKAVAMPHAGADALVAGWNRALAEICEGLVPEVFRRPPSGAQPQA